MEHRETHRHGGRRHGRMLRTGRMTRGRGDGLRMGRPFGGRGRGETIQGFFADNPDCAAKMARYAVAMMREEGLEDDEIREHLDHMHSRSFLTEIDIEDILS